MGIFLLERIGYMSWMMYICESKILWKMFIRNYVFLAISFFCGLCFVARGQEADDTIAGRELSEVVVKAQRIIPKGDHQLLLLSKENREFGTNALDAVSSLQLFKTSLNETTLQSADRQEVYILINGIPATGFELRGFKGEDIKNVEYYPVAPPQYMTLASGPVVNIVMKKRHDRLYTAYVNTLNSVNTGFGTNQLTASYTDSLNQVRVGYLADYRNISDLQIRSDYDYGADRQSLYDGRSKYAGIYQRIFTAMLAANSRTKEFQGDLQTGGSAQYAASVQYKYRDWSFGLQYNYLGDNDYTYGTGPAFSYCERKDWEPTKKLFRIAVTYSFSKGKARQHGQKIIQESSKEDGLTKVNKARGPQ